MKDDPLQEYFAKDAVLAVLETPNHIMVSCIASTDKSIGLLYHFEA